MGLLPHLQSLCRLDFEYREQPISDTRIDHLFLYLALLFFDYFYLDIFVCLFYNLSFGLPSFIDVFRQDFEFVIALCLFVSVSIGCAFVMWIATMCFSICRV